ncbi:hypothetical protein DPX16_15209 [Anabarilius grahami]|uniref:Uncharacterized protein n=1 Tax=Anabarilius grahami TaxID=495550 RepID=A0A3N0YWL8_ANAGA|nr:hypothetical protein DPX16_15209 [Anabarilius grahami]
MDICGGREREREVQSERKGRAEERPQADGPVAVHGAAPVRSQALLSTVITGLVAKALMGFPNSSKETENESKLKPYGEFKQIGPLQLGVNWAVASDTGFRLDGDPSSPWMLTCPALSVCDHTLELSKKTTTNKQK